jgi:hypothetical protein
MNTTIEEQHKQITLLQHRANLLHNPDRYIQDKNRAIKQFAETAYKFYGSCGKNKKLIIPLLEKLANLVFTNQDNKPIYEYQDELPRAWNSPMNGGWSINYIKWEIGHLISLNQGGTNNPANLSFQSARCNQHIQTSMNYFETTEYNCKEEVNNRISKLFILHNSTEWIDILDKIQNIVQSSV